MRPKVLFITRWYPNRVDKLDGNFIENHARAVALHCQLAVLYVGADPGMNDKTYDSEVKEEFGFPVVRVWYRNNDVSTRGIGRVRKLFRYISATRRGWKIIRAQFGIPQISHVHIFTRPALLALYLRTRYGIPFLITEHSSHFVHELPRWLPPKKLFAQYVARKAAWITVVSETLKKAISLFGLRGNYAIVPNVVFVPEQTPEATHDDSIRMVAIGGLTDTRKNIAGLIDTFARLHHRLSSTQLHIVRPVFDPVLQEHAVRSELLGDKIFFHENLSNDAVYQLLNHSSFLVVNSLSETFSMAAAEALACGKPVVATRCGGPEEFVNDLCGKLIPLNDPDALSEALIWMHGHFRDYDPSRIKAYINARFSSEEVGKKFVDLYASLLSS